MRKFINLFFLTAIIFSFLLGHVFSHHKSGISTTEKLAPDLEKIMIQNRYCTTNVKPITLKKATGSQGENKKTEPKELDFSIKKTWKITSYHDTKSQILGSIIIVKPIKGKPSTKWGFTPESKIIDVVKAFCINDSKKSASAKIDNEILKQIMDFNGLKSKTTKIGEELFTNGIKIPEELGTLLYYTPDYLIEQTEKDKLKEKNELANQAARTKEKKWISDNRPTILKKAEKFRQDQDDKIIDINGKLSNLKKEIAELKKNYKEIDKSLKTMFGVKLIQNMSDPEVKNLYLELFEKKDQFFSDNSTLEDIEAKVKKTEKNIADLKSRPNYKVIVSLIQSIQSSKSQKTLENNKKNIEVLNPVNLKSIEDSLQKANKEIENFSTIITDIDKLRKKVIKIDELVGSGINYIAIGIVIICILLAVGIGLYIYSQNRKLSSLRSATDSAGRKFSELEGQIKSTSEQLRSVATSSRSSNTQPTGQPTFTEKVKTPEEIIASKFDELVSDYKDAVDNFSKVAAFKQKWNGLALSRKERQDGTKTILINSSRAFEKSEIWCLNFDDKYFAFPGSTIKTNMAAYMNLDFEKAQRDFKGVFSITSGSSYTAEPSVLRRGGAGFVVERLGKLTFPQ